MKVEKEYIVIGTGYVILIGLFALLSAWLRDLFPILEDVNFQEAFFIALIFELGFVGLILRSFLSHKIARNILLAFFLLMPVIDYLIYGHHFHRFPHGFSLVGEFCFFTFLLGLYGLAFAGSCLLFFPMLIVLMAPVIAPFVTVVFLIIYALCVIFGKGGGVSRNAVVFWSTRTREYAVWSLETRHVRQNKRLCQSASVVRLKPESRLLFL